MTAAWSGALSASQFSDLLNATQGALAGFIRGLVADAEEARDLTQDVFVDAWRVARRAGPPFVAPVAMDDVRRWLFHAAYCAAVSALRRRGVIAWESLDAQQPYPPDPADDAPAFDARIVDRDALTTLNLPTRNAQPLGIAAGPDGALWFTESALGRIGRITQSGAITEYPLPSAGGWPVDIALGPDDALWFTEPGSGQIARMTTTGAVTEFPAPGASRLGGLTAGPDGNLWFTETGAIARLTRQGVITRFPLSSASILPGGITIGPDGALWFTEYSETNPITCDGSRVGRITTAGHISEYALPTPHSCASAITASSTTLWFIEAGQNAIGEIRSAG
jgi:virginiamycin B lyase